jgi:hypothetical protein
MYENFHNILGGTPKMISEVGDIDQGSRLPHLQVANLDVHFNYILKTQPLESLGR